VDTIEVAIMPVVIGQGISLLAGTDVGFKRPYELRLENLRETKTSGIIMTRYRVLPLS
jgi:hypothetical protein